MKPLVCLTLFLRTGKKFKLESGETFDDLRNNKSDCYPRITKSDHANVDLTNEKVGVKVGVILDVK